MGYSVRDPSSKTNKQKDCRWKSARNTEISATTPLQYVAIGAAMASLPLIHGGAQGLPGGRVNAA